MVEQLDVEKVLEVLRKPQSTEKLTSEEVYSAMLSKLLKDPVSFIGIEAELVRAVF